MKHDLKDVTFIIPVYYDSEDRRENLETIIDWLNHNFDTNILIEEVGEKAHFSYLESRVSNYTWVHQTNNYIHRTRMLNRLTSRSFTPYVVNYDADIILPVEQYLEAVKKLREGVDFVYPYTKFTRLSRQPIIKEFKYSLNIDYILNHPNLETYGGESFGGVLFFNKSSFIKAGMENEKYISYAPEDWERPIRFRSLGFSVERVEGHLYHIDHWIGNNSNTSHPYYAQNEQEFNKVKNFSPEQMKEYVKTFPWVLEHTKQIYSKEFIQLTEKEAKITASTIAGILKDKGLNFKSIVDLGSSSGGWLKEFKKVFNPDYILGIDSNITLEELLIDKEEFLLKDLSTSIQLYKDYDLVISIEVIEHIPKKYEDEFIENIIRANPKYILFSGATKFQGGQNHCNEQYATYWAEKFSKYGYYCHDVIRPSIFYIKEIPYYHRQNIFLYSKTPQSQDKILNYIHPGKFDDNI